MADEDEIIWRTREVPPVETGKPWKRDLGEVCPHGRRLMLVSAAYVRNHFDSDFDQGGNGYAYTFVPLGELWIDDRVDAEEIPFIGYHECHEAEDMKAGMSYDKAHEIAKRLEDKLRHRLFPGERRRRPS